MDRGFRRDTMQRVNQDALKYSTLPMLEREYSLYEIAVLTRAGPARSLGLKDLGHVGPGAKADNGDVEIRMSEASSAHHPTLCDHVAPPRSYSPTPAWQRDRRGKCPQFAVLEWTSNSHRRPRAGRRGARSSRRR